MAKKILLLISFIIILLSTSIAQQAVDNGFIFIDGRYIDGPYNIEVRDDLAIHVNGIRITQPIKWPIKDNRVFEDPGLPKNLTREMGLEGFKYNVDKNGNLHHTQKIIYLYMHYPVDEALEKIKEYYRALPFIKSLRTLNNKFTIELEDYYGNKKNVSVENDINLEAPPTKQKIISNLQKVKANLTKRLKKGDSYFFFGHGHQITLTSQKTSQFLKTLLKTLNNNDYSFQKKKEELQNHNIFLDEKSLKKLLDNLKPTQKLNEKIESIHNETKKNPIKKREMINTLLKSEELNNVDIAYSPNGKNLSIYYVNAYEREAWYQLEIESITNNIKDMDYDVLTNIWFDASRDDYDTPDPGGCTVENLENCKNADILSVHSHGMEGNIKVVYLPQQQHAIDWINGTFDLAPDEVHGQQWDDGTNIFNPWKVIAYNDYARYHWKEELDKSNALVLLNSCGGASSGIIANESLLESCGGAIGLGYPDLCSADDRTNNFNNLFQRLNGSYGNEYREITSAFNNFNHADDWEMMNHKNIKFTLAPTKKDYYPKENDNVGGNGVGYFEIDTYCNAINAEQALTFTTTGNVTISNVRWANVDAENKSNRLEYDWNGTGFFEVTVNVNSDFIRSWSSDPLDNGHRLDFNGVAPNTENGQYTFTGSGYLTYLRFSPEIVIAEPGHETKLKNYSVGYTNFLWSISGGNYEFINGTNENSVEPEIKFHEVATYTITLTSPDGQSPLQISSLSNGLANVSLTQQVNSYSKTIEIVEAGTPYLSVSPTEFYISPAQQQLEISVEIFNNQNDEWEPYITGNPDQIESLVQNPNSLIVYINENLIGEQLITLDIQAKHPDVFFENIVQHIRIYQAQSGPFFEFTQNGEIDYAGEDHLITVDQKGIGDVIWEAQLDPNCTDCDWFNISIEGTTMIDGRVQNSGKIRLSNVQENEAHLPRYANIILLSDMLPSQIIQVRQAANPIYYEDIAPWYKNSYEFTQSKEPLGEIKKHVDIGATRANGERTRMTLVGFRQFNVIPSNAIIDGIDLYLGFENNIDQKYKLNQYNMFGGLLYDRFFGDNYGELNAKNDFNPISSEDLRNKITNLVRNSSNNNIDFAIVSNDNYDPNKRLEQDTQKPFHFRVYYHIKRPDEQADYLVLNSLPEILEPNGEYNLGPTLVDDGDGTEMPNENKNLVLYAYNSAWEEIEVASRDENGILTFSNMPIGHEWYFNETGNIVGVIKAWGTDELGNNHKIDPHFVEITGLYKRISGNVKSDGGFEIFSATVNFSGESSTTTNYYGDYVKDLPIGWSGSINVIKEPYTFEVKNNALAYPVNISNLTTDQTINFTGYPPLEYVQDIKTSSSGGRFGRSVGVYNEQVIVCGTGTAEIYQYDRNGSQTWNEEFSATNSETTGFGWACAIYDNHAFVGAVQDSEKGTRSGAVYYYRKSGTNWKFEQKILPPFGTEDLRFGYSLAAYQGELIVGTLKERIYTYKYNGNTKKFDLKQMLSDDMDTFGAYLDMHGNYLVANAYPSTIKIFERKYDTKKWFNTSYWDSQNEITITRDEWESFGSSLAISDNYLVVGAPYHNSGGFSNSGAVAIYKRDISGNWNHYTDIYSENIYSEEKFGYAVDIQGKFVIIGAYADEQDLPSSQGIGSVEVYEVTGNINNPLRRHKKITAELHTLNINDRFGFAVGISKDHLIVGADGVDVAGNDAGAAYFIQDTTYKSTHPFGALSDYSVESGETYGTFQKTLNNLGTGSFSWEANSEADWVTITSGQSGETSSLAMNEDNSVFSESRKIMNNTTANDIEFSLAENTGPDRVAVIAVKSEDALNSPYLIEILQEGNSSIISGYVLDADLMPLEGATVTFTGTTNTTLTTDADGRYYVDLIDGWEGVINISHEPYIFGTETVTNLSEDVTFNFTGILLEGFQQSIVTAAPSNEFGMSVSIDETYAIVTGVNRAVIYEYENRNWVEKLSNTESFTNYYGWRCAISGNHAFVTGHLDSEFASYSGAVYYYKKVNGNWQFERKIVPPTPVADEKFGYSVTTDGKWLAIGTFTQKIYLYEIVNDVLSTSPQQILSSSLTSFGTSVSLSGRNLISGAYPNRAVVYEKEIDGPNWIEKQTIVRSDLESFGNSVAISDKYIVIGAPYESINGQTNAGAASIYWKNASGIWELYSDLSSESVYQYEYFGHSVSVDGDFVLVGVYGDIDETPGPLALGSAELIKLTDNISTPIDYQERIIAEQHVRTSGDRFGYAVSVSGQHLLIGADRVDVAGSNAGAAYFVENYFVEPQPDGYHEQMVHLPYLNEEDKFGNSVSISGNYAAIGAPTRYDAGSVYMYKKVDNQWALSYKIENPAPNYDNFGYEVDLYGDYIAIYSLKEKAVYIYKRNGEQWEQMQRIYKSNTYQFGIRLELTGERLFITIQSSGSYWSIYEYKFNGKEWEGVISNIYSSDRQRNDTFGMDYSVYGNYLISGALGWDHNTSINSNSGAAYIFKYENDQWVEKVKLSNPEPDRNDYFGGAVSIYEDIAVVGAYREDDDLEDSGLAYIYKRNGEQWDFVQTISPQNKYAYQEFGMCISQSDEFIVVGSGNAKGQMHIFREENGIWTEYLTVGNEIEEWDNGFGYDSDLLHDNLVAGAIDDNNVFFYSNFTENKNIPIAATLVDTLEIGSEGGELSFELFNIGSGELIWTAQTSSDWITFPYGNTGSESVRVESNTNIGDVRTDEIHVSTNDLDNPLIIFYVKQKDGLFTVVSELNPGENAGGYFGATFDIDSNFVIVGAHGSNSNIGSATIYEKNNGIWTASSFLTPSNGVKYDQFGRSVSILGNYAVIGATGADINFSMSGAIYIFENNSGNWSQVAMFYPNDVSSYIRYGENVSINGDFVFVSAGQDRTRGVNSGAVYVYKRTNGNWSFYTKLHASDAKENGVFGYDVSSEGEWLIVGSYGDNVNGSSSGSAYTFKYNGSNWIEQGKLTAFDGTAGQTFGKAVFLNSNMLVITSSNYAYTFEFDGTNWNTLGKAYQGSGKEIDISSNYLVVGNNNEDNETVTPEISNTGAVHVFERNGNEWELFKKLYGQNQNDKMGYSVRIFNNVIWASAPYESTNNDGKIYTFSNPLPANPQPLVANLEKTNKVINLSAITEGRNINLHWELNNIEDYNSLNIEKLTDGNIWEVIKSFNRLAESYSIKAENGEHKFRIVVKENDNENTISNEAEVALDIPTDYSLYQNYPNPFNPLTNISFALPENSFTNITIYNSLGQKVIELVNAELDAGRHKVEFDASSLATGIYIYRIIANDFVDTKKMMLIK